MISIIIPTLKEADYIERTLKNLEQLEIPHEIIITDGGSTDDTLPIVRRYTDKVVVWDKPRRQTFGEAKNAAAALATHDFLVFIDADVIIPEPTAFFKELLAYFETHPKLVGLTVPQKVDPLYAKGLDWFFIEPLNIWYVFANNVLGFGNASGEFQMIRDDTYKKIGGYREDLPAGEDTDIFVRLSHIGKTHMYTKRAVFHSCRRPHKKGWIRLYSQWIFGGISYLIHNKPSVDEWEVVR